MKASCNWLRELVEVDADDKAIAEKLTAAGLEIEGTTVLGAGLAGVIVAEVRATRRHPKGDKLTLVDVFDGREVTQVVCGAPNVPPPGGRVAWARPGATLPGGITMAAKEVRGVLSPGMLCAEDELGLGQSHAGIVILDGDAAPGADVARLLGLPDTILEVNVTPNRPDCLGHLGLARELCALFPGARLRPLDTSLAGLESAATVEKLASVELVDAEGCPRYTARVLEGVKVGRSPLAARVRLEALGVRAINDVVDATNLGLLENGHPLHAFDLDKLAGARIVVRRARDGEPIVTLDGQTRALTADDVVICDAERPVAVAGVMGGSGSEVTDSTTRILLESAHFAGARVRRTGRRLGLSSEASMRFERGTDPNAGVEVGSLRCARRIAASTGARVAKGVIDAYPKRIAPATVTLRPDRARRVIGLDLATDEQTRILGALGLAPSATATATGTLAFAVPTFRPDLTREIDLIEEIVRVHGYDRVPATLPAVTAAPSTARDAIAAAAESVRDALAGFGFAETISFAFVAPERIAALGFADWRARPIRLANPLREEQSALRTSLLPGLLGALAHNRAHAVAEARLFEVGATFQPSSEPLPVEPWRAAAVLMGRRPGWLKPGEPLDFFDAKGALEALAERMGARLGYRPLSGRPAGDGAWLHPGQGALVTDGETVVGAVGEVHPEVREKLGLDERCFAFEIDLQPLAAAAPPAFAELPRFPGSARDLSFFVAADVPADEIARLLASASPLAESVRALEDYREAGRVPAGKKGMLWSIVYRSRERTLTEDEVAREHARVREALHERFAVEYR